MSIEKNYNISFVAALALREKQIQQARAAVVRSLRHEICIADNGPEWLYYTSGLSATYSAHPSPKSVNLGFFGSRPFSRANLALTLNNPGCAPVDWRLS